MARGKHIECEGTILEALGNACEYEELRDEMTSWRDNMAGTNLENGEKFQTVSEAADTLENAEVEEKARKVEEAVEEALEGRAFKAGCPPHVEGQKCKRCKWDGKRRKYWGAEPELSLYDEPKASHFERQILAQVREGNTYTTWSASNHSKEEAHAKARAYYEREMTKRQEWEAKNAIPKEIPDVPELDPCEIVVENIDGMKIKWHEFRKYGKRATSLSRSDRMGNANAGIQAGIEAIKEVLEDHREEDERIENILDAVEELEGAIEECEGIEFPGMFG